MVPNYRWQVEIVPALVRIRFSETSVCRSSEINRESLRFEVSDFVRVPLPTYRKAAASAMLAEAL
jgi:hypothetical protein